ncbi:sugar ABC transporter substrate-binding protein [Haloechinothrix salitolerans]|uniref:Sugar ABC transporter substrate-binding protein n=1 Tax=Haloechinothrix salitolerans TaxID=926830 RepID=A0ABW2C917_9PSEU
MKRLFTRPSAVIAGLAAAALVLAGCSSQGGKQEETAALDTPTYKIAMITHGVPGDTFFDIVRAGAEDAATKSNIEIQYAADPDSAKQSTLVDNAIDQGVDGIALTLAKPDALKGVVKRANEAGIPVVAFNSGIEEWQDVGAMSYYGTDEHLAGTAFGKRLNEEGAKHALCVIQEQGHVALETRCQSLKDAFDGETTKVYVNGADMTSVQSTLQAKLQADSSIDYVVTLGAPFALTALDSVDSAGSDATVATFDTNKDLVSKIEDGSVEFAVDQQPYLQGYLTIDAFWLYLTNGNVAGGGKEPVLTGPAFIDKTNIDSVAEFAAKGTR